MHTSASVIFVPDSVCLDDDTGKGVNSGVDIDLECEWKSFQRAKNEWKKLSNQDFTFICKGIF